ncbi:MAG: phosphodiester glycosidase family protein [Patescibacteria group bacterium]|jgi:hypothetical protein
MKSTKILNLILLGLLFSGAGCLITPDKKPQAETIGQVMNSPAPSEMQKLPVGWERRQISYADGRKVSWVIAPFKADNWSWSLANDPSNPLSVARWREIVTADLVINGSYFDESFQPAGYFKGNELGNLKPWPDKKSQADPKSYSGLIKIKNGQLQIIYLVDAQQDEPSKDEQALLTYPTLLAKGQPLIKDDSQKYARRTVLAQDDREQTYVVMTESGLASLYETAQWLATQPEKFTIAVNLDGGPSTGIAYSQNESEFNLPSASVPNVLTATLR